MAKVNRHNHPLMVNARRESYYAGKADGYKEGYQKGYEAKCTELHHHYRVLLSALQSTLDVAYERIRMLEEEVKKNG